MQAEPGAVVAMLAVPGPLAALRCFEHVHRYISTTSLCQRMGASTAGKPGMQAAGRGCRQHCMLQKHSACTAGHEQGTAQRLPATCSTGQVLDAPTCENSTGARCTMRRKWHSTVYAVS